MDPKVIGVENLGGHVLRIRFEDGAEGEIDFAPELEGEVFEPLKDPVFFSRYEIHPDFGTLVWPNGADFAPEFLYSRLKTTV